MSCSISLSFKVCLLRSICFLCLERHRKMLNVDFFDRTLVDSSSKEAGLYICDWCQVCLLDSRQQLTQPYLSGEKTFMWASAILLLLSVYDLWNSCCCYCFIQRCRMCVIWENFSLRWEVALQGFWSLLKNTMVLTRTKHGNVGYNWPICTLKCSLTQHLKPNSWVLRK